VNCFALFWILQPHGYMVLYDNFRHHSVLS